MTRYLIPRLRDVLFIAILVSSLALGRRMMNVDGDLGRHLTMGRYILETNKIPTHDLFSFTMPGKERPAYEWLTQIFFSLAEKTAGLDGVVLLTGILVSSAFLIVQTDSQRRSKMPLTALAVTILAASASSIHWLPRPHVVTFLFLAIWIERLDGIQTGRAIPLWQFPLLMLIWVNAHGGFIFGILAWMAYLAGWVLDRRKDKASLETGKKLVVVGVLSLITTIITPNLLGNWVAVLNNSNQFVLSRTVETMPPELTRLGNLPFIILFLTAFILLVVTRKSIPSSHILLLAGFAILSFMVARNIPLFSIAAAPIISACIPKTQQLSKPWRTSESNISSLENSLNGAVLPILISVGLIVWVSLNFHNEKNSFAFFSERIFPVQAADWLTDHPQSGNMFNEFNWGGYLIYRLWPASKVFIDSQTDFYGENMLRKYDSTISAREGWQLVFDEFNIKWAILPISAPLNAALRDSGWEVLYQDNTAVIFREPR